jgi:hypothetical protein
MITRTWIRNLFARTPRTIRKEPARFRPLFETLEARVTPTTTYYTAANTADLVSAIKSSNSAGGMNTITLTATAVPQLDGPGFTEPYLLQSPYDTPYGSSGLPMIAAGNDLTINGANNWILRDTNDGDFRLFTVDAGATLNLNSVGLADGRAPAFTPPSSGKPGPNGLVPVPNQTPGQGGAIYSAGTLNADKVTFDGNWAIGAEGPNNVPGQGGAIYVAGGTAVIVHSTLEWNEAIGALTNSTLEGQGGALYAAGGQVTFFSSTLASNSALGAPTQFASGAGLTLPGGNAEGGGAYVAAGSSVSFINTTVSGNKALGGDNTAGKGADAYGGGIYAAAGTATITQTTIANNTAAGDISDGGGLYGDATAATIQIRNSLVANNHANFDVDIHAVGTFSSSGNNVVGSALGGVGLDPTTNILNPSVVGLAALTPTAPISTTAAPGTMALLPGSAAINAGLASYIPPNTFNDDGSGNITEPLPYDELGQPRNFGGAPDDGAYEVQVNVPTISRAQAALTVNQGDLITNTGTFGDADGNSAVVLTASVGNLIHSNVTGTWSWTYNPPTSGTKTVTITATGNQGYYATATFTLTVNPVAPTITVSGAASVNEGAFYSLTLEDDTNPDPVTFYRVNWGDGNLDSMFGLGTKLHAYQEGGTTYAITVDRIDAAGVHVNRASPFSVTVNDVPPSITSFIVPATGTEESAVALSAAASDPAGASDTHTFTWTITQPDGGTFSLGGASASFTPPEEGTYGVSVAVSDGEGGSTTQSGSIAVAGVPATIAISGAAGINLGAPYVLTLGAVSHPGPATVSQYTVHWGDGSSTSYSGGGAVTHVYTYGPATRAITVDLTESVGAYSDGTYANCGNPLSVSVTAHPYLDFTSQTAAANPFNAFGVGTDAHVALGDLYDNDTLDAVVGAADGTLHFFKNTGTAIAPNFVEQTGAANPFNGINVGADAAPALADLTGNGRLDLVVGNSSGGLLYYQNTGTATNPVFTELKGSASPLTGINPQITHSAPALADVTGDGLLDLVVGNSSGGLLYFHNTGTATNPVFTPRTGAANPFDGVNVGANSTPALAALEGTGALDLVVGSSAGTLQYYENTGTATNPDYVQQTGADDPLAGLSVGASAAPALGKLEGNGQFELVVGAADGTLSYFHNITPLPAVTYTELTGAANPFNGFSTGQQPASVGFSTSGPNALPALGDLYGDGRLDLVLGCPDGTLQFYRNTGTATNPVFTAETGTANPFNGINVGSPAAPALADLSGDGLLDLVVGGPGHLSYYKNTGTATNPVFTAAANPFPSFLQLGDPMYPALGDVQGNGKVDVAVGGFYYPDVNSAGHFEVDDFQNTGSATSPAFNRLDGAGNPFEPFLLGFDASGLMPALADVNGDGTLDAVVGLDAYNHFYYYENVGTAINPDYVLQGGSAHSNFNLSGLANPFNGISFASPGEQFAFGDLDGDGDQDAVVGMGDGTLHYLEANRVPVVVNTIPDQTFSGPGSQSFTVPANTFLDLDGNTLTYSSTLASGAPLPAWLSFDPHLRTFSGNPSPADTSPLMVRVTASDGHGQSAADDFQLTLVNINDPPTNIALSHTSVAEHQPAGELVGAFSSIDRDVGDTFTYTLAGGPGLLDNSSFTIDAGGNLRTAATFDLQTRSSYSIVVRSTGGTGLFTTKEFTITITSALAVSTLLEGPGSGTDSDLVTARDAWSATSNAGWLHTSSSGTDAGLATFTFDANPGATRTGTLTIAGETLTVTQAGSSYVAANPLTTLASSGLALPDAVAVDGSGNVYIADFGHNAIDEWNAATGQVAPLISSLPGAPYALSVDRSGNLYFIIAGNNAVEEWNAATGLYSPLVSLVQDSLTGVAVDVAGNVYFSVTDPQKTNNAIEERNARTGLVSTLVPLGATQPSGMAVDAAGDVYIADFVNGAIDEWNAATGLRTLVSSGLGHPFDVTVDGSGNVYILDALVNGVREWNAATGKVSTLVSSGLDRPDGVAVDGSGNVYIADTFNNAVKEVPRAFVSTTAVSEAPFAGSDTLAVLPATESLIGPFAPTSDQSWLTVDSGANGVDQLSFTTNGNLAPRTAHLSVLGQQISVTQAPLVTINVTGYSVVYDGEVHTATGTATGYGGVDLSADLDLSGTQHTGVGSTTDIWNFLANFGGVVEVARGPVSDSISPASLTVTANPQSKAAGAVDPLLTYQVTTGNLFGNDALSGLLMRDAGETVGAYPIRQGSLTAGPNYALTFINSVLFITATSDPLQSAQSVGVSSTVPNTAATTPASTGGPQLTATGTGFDGSLTVAQYQGAPVSGFNAAGSFFDVNIGSSDLGAGSSVQVVFSNLTPGVAVFWLNGSTWQPVTDASGNIVVADTSGTATVTLTTATSPSLAQPTGTDFFAGTFQPTLTATPSAGSVTLSNTGSPKLTDTATLSGGYHETGTLTFTLYQGTTLVDTETAAVSGDGIYSTPTGYTLPTTGTVTGSYQWDVSYSGDANNNNATDNNATAEQVKVVSANPTLTASAGPTVVLGTGVHLTASATLADGYHETGLVTFTLYDPAGRLVDTETASVSGDGSYTTPSGYVPLLAGTYQWVAAYSGDSNNACTSTAQGSTPQVAVGAGATVVGNALYLVGGNTTNDQVNISSAGSSQTGSTGIQVHAKLNGTDLGNVTYSQSFGTVYVVGFGGNEHVQENAQLAIATVVLAGNGNDQVQLGNGNNRVTMGNGNDNVTLGNGNNAVTLGNGNDNVTIGGGNNTLNTVTVGNGNDTIRLGDGNNLVVEGNGHDSVQAGNGDNLIVGGLGKHTIQVGNGSNILIDGSVQLTKAGDTLAAVLADWIQNGSSGISSRLNPTLNTTNANTMLAGSGFDWYWASYAHDTINPKATDLLN